MLKDKLNQVTPNLAKVSMKTPKNGKWSGDAGNSAFWPNKLPDKSSYKLNDLQKIVGKDGIPFKNGYPDFSKYSTHRVDVNGMIGKQSTDIPRTIKELVSKGHFKNEKEVREFVTKNDLIFHHEPGGKSMSLVKKIVHDSVRHEGGASGLRGLIHESK